MDQIDKKDLKVTLQNVAVTLNKTHVRSLKFIQQVFSKIKLTNDLKKVILDGFLLTRNFQIAMYKLDEKQAIAATRQMEKNPCIAFLNEFGIPQSMKNALNILGSKPKRMRAQYAAKWICEKMWNNLDDMDREHFTQYETSFIKACESLRAGGKYSKNKTLGENEPCSPGECIPPLKCDKKINVCTYGGPVDTELGITLKSKRMAQDRGFKFGMGFMILLWLFLVSLFVEGMVRQEPQYGGKTVKETGMIVVNTIDNLIMREQQEELVVKTADVGVSVVKKGFETYSKMKFINNAVRGVWSIYKAKDKAVEYVAEQGVDFLATGLSWFYASKAVADSDIDEKIKDTAKLYYGIYQPLARMIFFLQMNYALYRFFSAIGIATMNYRVLTYKDVADIGSQLVLPFSANLANFQQKIYGPLLSLGAFVLTPLLTNWVNDISKDLRIKDKPFKKQQKLRIEDQSKTSAQSNKDDKQDTLLLQNQKVVQKKTPKKYEQNKDYKVEDLIYDPKETYLWQVMAVNDKNEMTETRINKTKSSIYVQKNEKGVWERACIVNQKKKCIFAKTDTNDDRCNFVNSKCKNK